MVDRFAVRKCDTGYGVWDAAMNGWRTPFDLAEPDAVELEIQLNERQVQIEAETEAARAAVPPAPKRSTPVGFSVHLDPPRPCQIRMDGRWVDGEIRYWLRERTYWSGEARVEGGDWAWHNDESLRAREI